MSAKPTLRPQQQVAARIHLVRWQPLRTEVKALGRLQRSHPPARFFRSLCSDSPSKEERASLTAAGNGYSGARPYSRRDAETPVRAATCPTKMLIGAAPNQRRMRPRENKGRIGGCAVRPAPPSGHTADFRSLLGHAVGPWPRLHQFIERLARAEGPVRLPFVDASIGWSLAMVMVSCGSRECS